MPAEIIACAVVVVCCCYCLWRDFVVPDRHIDGVVMMYDRFCSAWWSFISTPVVIFCFCFQGAIFYAAPDGRRLEGHEQGQAGPSDKGARVSTEGFRGESEPRLCGFAGVR